MTGARRLAVAAPLIAILLAASILSVDAALASSEAAGGVTGLRTALARTPIDATIHEQLALAQARSQASAEDSGAALTHAVRALELRPSSPYAWAVLAEVQYRAGVADATFQTALQRAADLGPWEPGVQQTVAFYGLAVWDEVSDATRASIERMVAAGLREDPAAMMQIAKRRGRLTVACRHVDGTSRIPNEWAQLCKSTGAT